MMVTEYYECRTGSHFKFWEVRYPAIRSNSPENYWSACWGKIGTEGQRRMWVCSSTRAAYDEAKKVIAEKIAKGYKIGRVEQAVENLSNASQQQTETVSDDERKAIRALLAVGFTSKRIAESLGLKIQQVAAVAAHETMGNYDPLPVSTSKIKPNQPMGRRFKID